MNWEFLTGDINWETHGGVFVSDAQKPEPGYEYWITIEVTPIEDKQWARSLGFKDREDEDGYKEFKQARGKLADVELLHSYGTRAPLDIELYGYNAEELLEQAKHEAEFLGGTFFGFQMDKQRNMVGATGWDLLNGNVWGKHK